MPSVQDVLRESGFTDEQIAQLDGRAITAFSGVLTQAEQTRAQAELERQANIDFYENRIVPSLTTWDEEKQRIENEKARVAAEAAFYRTQAEQARSAGFIPTDAPTFQASPQQRDTGGRYVAGAPGSTPGSPTFFDVNKVYDRAGDAISTIADIDWRYRQLFDGKPLPVSPSELIKAADARRLDPKIYADQVYGFTKREAELAEQRQKEHDDKIRKEAATDRDKYWAERVGSNPDVRRPMQSPQMVDIARATKAGTRQDPLMMSDTERRRATAVAIRTELAEAEAS